jgi:hypothetical protein
MFFAESIYCPSPIYCNTHSAHAHGHARSHGGFDDHTRHPGQALDGTGPAAGVTAMAQTTCRTTTRGFGGFRGFDPAHSEGKGGRISWQRGSESGPGQHLVKAVDLRYLLIHERAREGGEPCKHHYEYSEADEPRAELSHGFASSFLAG